MIRKQRLYRRIKDNSTDSKQQERNEPSECRSHFFRNVHELSSDWLVRRSFTGIFVCFCYLWILDFYILVLVLQLVFYGLYCTYFIASQLWSNIPAIPNKLFLSLSSAQVCSKHLLLFLSWAEAVIFVILPESASECKNCLKRKWFRNYFELFTTSQGNGQQVGTDNVYVSCMLRTHLLKGARAQGWVYVSTQSAL